VDTERLENNSAVFKVTVVDTGIGMNTEQQQTIFEAFGQADKSVTRLYGGTGLGLVISQRLAREMKGDIGFISEERRGSTFWFTFECEINPVSLTQPIQVNELADKSILYLEPHTHGRIATSDVLSSWQMTVMPIESLAELSNAIEQQESYDYALISHDVTPASLADLKALIVTLKEKVGSVHLAINSNSPNLQEALVASGAASCLSKPLTPARLAKALLPADNTPLAITAQTVDQKVPIKVLAVDDNEANLKLIKALLSEQVQEVITASNGEEALTLCKSEKFALIFMDIQMPVMDGVTALGHIKSSTFNDQTPIIAVTAHALSGEKEKLLTEGFSSYMTKPIDETMLKHTIYEYCDLDLLSAPTIAEQFVAVSKTIDIQAEAIDWQLALSRTGNKVHLAKDMLSGLVKSLPELKQQIEDAITCQDNEQAQMLIHKLNGACCYTGVPALGKVAQQIETQLKQQHTLDDLEPEFFELFERMECVLEEAPRVINDVEMLEDV
ncbi:MAG: two-component sensor histidine kinase BarA, partial [Colwelliaceae bacterium]|nr:two-component sensor histidine kinase BarA [Colwelliaceae bacterium]